MKKISLTIATMVVLTVSIFAQHSNCNNYSQQTYNNGGGYNSSYVVYAVNSYPVNHPHHIQGYYSQNNYNGFGSCNNHHDNDYDHDNNYNSNENNHYNYNNNAVIYPMNERDFDYAKQSIASKGFDETRLIMAKQVVGSNRLLACQIKQLMDLMSFESTKMDLAKFSWNHIMDRENFYKLNDAFAFESSIYELNRYTGYN